MLVVNTEKGTSFVSAAEVEITIPLTIPVDNVSMMKFKYFVMHQNSHPQFEASLYPSSKSEQSLLNEFHENGRLFPNINGFVNTEKGTSFVSAAEVEITIPLTIPHLRSRSKVC